MNVGEGVGMSMPIGSDGVLLVDRLDRHVIYGIIKIFGRLGRAEGHLFQLHRHVFNFLKVADVPVFES